MKLNKKIAIALVCVFAAGMAAFFLLNDQTPAPNTPVVVGEATNSIANVNDIESSEPVKQIDPSTRAPLPQSDATLDPVIDPSKTDTDITVPITGPVEKPTETNPDLHVKGDENEPPKPTPTPPVNTPKPEPPKDSEPKGGDTNEKGQVWVPGFGWVTPGDGNKGGSSGSDGDINKQVGDM